MTFMHNDLIKRAYEIGRSRNVSFACGYSLSPDGQTIFALNPNSPQGVYITADGVAGFGDPDPNYILFDMSQALEEMPVA
jgi:hypothetical protein